MGRAPRSQSVLSKGAGSLSRQRPTGMRLLFLNPNTSAELTDLGVALASRVARPETEIVPATGQFGARYIGTRATAAIAAHAALDAFARCQPAPDVVLLACFGDPGLLALRELAPVPVVGMAEPNFPSLRVAIAGGRCWKTWCR